MSSAGQILGGAVGAFIGFYVGGPQGAIVGAQAGITTGGMIDPPKGPDMTGPRLSDSSVQLASYGQMVPRGHGVFPVAGIVTWLENNKYKEVVTKKKVGGKGGPVSTVTSYAYYATFQVVLCKGPIAGVRRIWAQGNLVYDAGADGIEAIIASNQLSDLFDLHVGTDDQPANTRMQATLGLDCPAYGGIAYIVFRDFPLEDYGNNLSYVQLKIEVVTQGDVTAFEHLGTQILSNQYAVYDIRQRVFGYDEPFLYYTQPLNDSRVEPGITDIRKLNVITGESTTVEYSRDTTNAHWGSEKGQSDAADIVFGTKDYYPGISNRLGVIRDTSVNSVSTGYSIRDGMYYTSRGDGRMLQYTITPFRQIRAFTCPFAISTSTASNMWTCQTTPDHVYFGVIDTNSKRMLLKFSIASGAYVDHVEMPTGIGGVGVVEDDEIYYPIGQSLFLTRDFFASSVLLGTHTSIESVSVTSYAWAVTKLSPGVIAICEDLLADYRISVFRYASGITATDVTLSDIVSAECALSSVLTPTDYDTSSLTDVVRGYRIASHGSIRAALSVLQGAYPFDVVASGYQIKFVRRGGASVLTVDADDLDARPYASSSGIAEQSSMEMAALLPARVIVNYLDVDREYDTGSQIAERLGTSSGNETTIEIPLCLNAGEAARMANVLQSMYWLEQTRRGPYNLPPTYAAIEAGDVVTINSRDLRVRDITYEADGRVSISGTPAAPFARVYQSSAVGVAGTVPAQSLSIAGPSSALLIDCAAVSSAMDQPGFVCAMSGYLSGWSGGTLVTTSDSGQSWDSVQGFVAPVPIGRAQNTLSQPADLRVIDKTQRLSVLMQSGALESVTELAMLNGSNWFAYGAEGRWEIIAAQNATLEVDGTYTLDAMLRGQKGTEWACALHSVGDYIVLLTDENVAFIQRDAGAINSTSTWRAVTAGKSVDSAGDISFYYAAENLRPLAPVYLSGWYDVATGAWNISWMRRTRVGGEWRDGGDALLGEAVESYELDIYADANYQYIARTLTIATGSVTYTAAQQQEDALDGAPIYVRVQQISATVGRGRSTSLQLTPPPPYTGYPPVDTPPIEGVYQFHPVAWINGTWIALAIGYDGDTPTARYFKSSDGKAFVQLGADQAPPVWSDYRAASVCGLTTGVWVSIPISSPLVPASSLLIARGTYLGAAVNVGTIVDLFGGNRPAFAVTDASSAVVYTWDNHVYKSNADASSWTYKGVISGDFPGVFGSENSGTSLNFSDARMVRGSSVTLCGWNNKLARTTDTNGVASWATVARIREDFFSESSYNDDGLLLGARYSSSYGVWYALVKHVNTTKVIRSTNSGATWTIDKTFAEGEGGANTDALTGPFLLANKCYIYDSTGAIGFERDAAGTWTSFTCAGISAPDWIKSRQNNTGTLIEVIEMETYGPRLYWTDDGKTFTACTGLGI